ncbi:MAG: DUF262 domain-containing protein [Rhodospirillaceae bacterium]
MHVKPEWWRLMALVTEAREGKLAPPAGPKTAPWTPDQIEALWDNILNDWPIGPFVLVDVSKSRTTSWRGRIGPHSVIRDARRRMTVAEGAGKLAALAWSLLINPEASTARRLAGEDGSWWLTDIPVLDIDDRRVRFVGSDFNPSRQLPVRLLPESGPCLRALNAMNLRTVEREWVNQSARRLLEAGCMVYIFPDTSDSTARRMITNCRQMNDHILHASL